MIRNFDCKGQNISNSEFHHVQPTSIRPGALPDPATTPTPVHRLTAYFRNAAQGNLAIQLLVSLGVPANQLGVTPPEQIQGGQGLLLSIPCDRVEHFKTIEDLCRELGAEIHRHRP